MMQNAEIDNNYLTVEIGKWYFLKAFIDEFFPYLVLGYKKSRSLALRIVRKCAALKYNE